MRGGGRGDEGREKQAGGGLSHLYMTVFLYNFAIHMVIPAITDVTMGALCPGLNECSFAIYLTGFQPTVWFGNSDDDAFSGQLIRFAQKKSFANRPNGSNHHSPWYELLTSILAYNRTIEFFYVYYLFKTLTAMVCEGSVHCLSLAYAVAAFVGVLATVYMKIFLPESVTLEETDALESKLLDEESPSSEESPSRTKNFFRGPSVEDTLSLLKTSKVFSQVAFVAFLDNVGDVGLRTSLMYYLKACFHFDKDNFANLMVMAGITGTVSQLVLMPLLVPAVGEEKLLSVALFFNCAHMFLYSIAWSSWVPYCAAMFSILIVFSQPCLRSITSKQVGPNEQGKAQGCISGISSFANVMSPLAFSLLTALFFSKDSPFHFPGFSIMLTGFAVMVAFTQSLMIRSVRTRPCGNKCTNMVIA